MRLLSLNKVILVCQLLLFITNQQSNSSTPNSSQAKSDTVVSEDSHKTGGQTLTSSTSSPPSSGQTVKGTPSSNDEATESSVSITSGSEVDGTPTPATKEADSSVPSTPTVPSEDTTELKASKGSDFVSIDEEDDEEDTRVDNKTQNVASSSCSSTPRTISASGDKNTLSTLTNSSKAKGATVRTHSSSPLEDSKLPKSKNKEKTETSELDIKKKETNPNCNYTDDNNSKTATFEAKEGYGFNLVKQGNTEIWKTDKESEYATKVVVGGIGSGKKNISVYLHSERVKNYNKPGKNKPWTERSQLIELNLKDKQSTYEYDYLKDPSTNLMSYTTKHGFQFNLVKQNRTEIWKSTEPCDYVSKVELQDLGGNKFDLTLFPTNNTRITFNKPGKNKPWEETTSLKVVISTLDNSGSTKKNDISQYKMNEESDGVYKCEFKNGSRCTEFKHNNNSVWKHDSNEFGDYYPMEIVFNLEKITVEIMIYLLIFVCKDNKWNLVTKALYDDFTNKSFTIVTSEKEDGSNSSENNPSHFIITTLPNSHFTINFKPNVKCVEIKYDNNSLWKHLSDKHKNLFPDSFIYKPRVFISIGFYPFFYLFKYDSTNDKWKLKKDSSYKGKLPLVSSEHPKYLKIITSFNGNTTENDPSKYRVYNHEYKKYMYIFNSEVKCTELRYDNKLAWKYDYKNHPDKYPNTISLDTKNSIFILDFNGTFVGFKLTDTGLDNYTRNLGKFTTLVSSITLRNDFSFVNYQSYRDSSVDQPPQTPKIPDISPGQPKFTYSP